MINILEHIIEKSEKEKVHAILGGTHLDFASPQQVEETVAALKKFKVGHIGVSHCTGLKAALGLYAEVGERFFFGQVGEALGV
jgi:7,8-dihydropterin-6-yl-methyl-4-(beta-D-ribofuranosyl)aminobenzene 5'-phosphate synthase